MAINETISKGNKYRRLKDAANKVWQRISFWTAASDVEFENGNTLQSTLGTVTGITDSLTSNSSTVAASAAAVYSLNSKITSFQTGVDALYNKFVSLGVTPSAKTLAAITNATQTVYNTGYNKGVAGATKNYDYKVYTFAQYATADEGSTQTYTCPANGKIMCAAFASSSDQAYDWGSAWTKATSTSGSTVTTYASASGKFNTDSDSSRWCRAYNSSGWVNVTKDTIINISGGGEARWGGYVTLVFVY